MMLAVTLPLTFFEGRIVRRLYEANIASTSEMGAFSQLHVNVGSCEPCVFTTLNAGACTSAPGFGNTGASGLEADAAAIGEAAIGAAANGDDVAGTVGGGAATIGSTIG